MAHRRSARVAELPPRMPPAHRRPPSGRDVLTLLIDFPQQELLAAALGHTATPALLSLELVSKRVRSALRVEALHDVWRAHMPMQLEQMLRRDRNCLGQEHRNANQSLASSLTARDHFLRSRRATQRLRHIVDSAKTEYKIKTGRNGAVDTCPNRSMAPESLYRWWEDVREATLDGADIQLRDNSGQTLLHWAVCLGDFKMAHELCKAGLSPTAGAKPHGPNRPGHRPVDIVIPGSRIEGLLNEFRHQ